MEGNSPKGETVITGLSIHCCLQVGIQITKPALFNRNIPYLFASLSPLVYRKLSVVLNSVSWYMSEYHKLVEQNQAVKFVQ